MTNRFQLYFTWQTAKKAVVLPVIAASLILSQPSLASASTAAVDQTADGRRDLHSLGYENSVPASDRPSLQNILDTASSDIAFNTLVTAVKIAGLADTLKGAGPFKVFAPNNQAFAAIPREQFRGIVEEHGGLAEIPKGHVVSGAMTAKELTELGSVVSVNGQRLNIDSRPGVLVNGAEVIQSDISATNGIIHVIDRVILPDEGRDSPQTGS